MGTEETKEFSKGPTFGKRHITTILLFMCFLLEYASRENFSLAIVAMTNSSTSSNPDIPTYDWSDTHILLSAFYWGFVVTQIPGGQLSKIFGSKYILLVGTLVNSIAAICTPFMAQWLGSKGVMVCRIAQGLIQGVFFPSVHTLLGQWVPTNERSRLTMAVYLGLAIGMIVANPVTGLLATSDAGWPVSFYLFGSLGFGWCVAWYLFGYNSPASHPSITNEERRYIESSLGETDENIPTPWSEIVTSKPVWALVFGSIGIEYGNAFIATEIPTYLNKVMNFEAASDGFMFAIPHVVGTSCAIFYGFLSDFLVQKKYLSTVNARRFFSMYAATIQAAMVIWIAFLTKDSANFSVVLFCLVAVGGGASLYGTSVNIMDISPRFAGVIIGVTQTLSMSLSMFGPILVQLFVSDEHSDSQWRVVFFIEAALYVIPTAIYCFLASGEKQWWDAGPKKSCIGTT